MTADGVLIDVIHIHVERHQAERALLARVSVVVQRSQRVRRDVQTQASVVAERCCIRVLQRATTDTNIQQASTVRSLTKNYKTEFFFLQSLVWCMFRVF